MNVLQFLRCAILLEQLLVSILLETTGVTARKPSVDGRLCEGKHKCWNIGMGAGKGTCVSIERLPAQAVSVLFSSQCMYDLDRSL